MHWVGWNKLYQPKNEGEAGFHELQAFNKATLAKQA